MSSNAPFRLAIVGAGLISREAHLPAALKSRHVELVALVDPVVARARELAADFGIRPQVAADVAEVLGKIDGAVIAAPNKAHHPIAKTCLAAGKHVLIEKPMTTTVAEADDLLAAARASGASIAVGYVTRFRNSTRLLAELLANSYFGKVHEFYHQFGSAGGWAPLSGYNLTATAAGGGVLVVTGTHFLDRMLALWGYPDELSYEDDSHGGPEANCLARFLFHRDGHTLRGAVRYSKTSVLPGGLVLRTEAGTVLLADKDESDIVLRPLDAPQLEHVVRAHGKGYVRPGEDLFRAQLDDFVAASREGRPAMVDGSAGLNSVRLIEETYRKRRPALDRWYAARTSSLAVPA